VYLKYCPSIEKNVHLRLIDYKVVYSVSNPNFSFLNIIIVHLPQVASWVTWSTITGIACLVIVGKNYLLYFDVCILKISDITAFRVNSSADCRKMATCAPRTHGRERRRHGANG